MTAMRNLVYARPVADDIRFVVTDLVSAVHPLDQREIADQSAVLEWIASGRPLFRITPPDTPPKHLVSYFVPFDESSSSLLLGDHRKSGLWLPPGGHCEDHEDPRDTVMREASEELSIAAHFHRRFGAGLPFFLTVTPTQGTPSHTDVSLWFVLRTDRAAELHPDEREFRTVQWFGIDDPHDWTDGAFDPEMHRFVRKLRAALLDDSVKNLQSVQP